MIKILVANRFRSIFGAMFDRGRKGEVKKATKRKVVLFSIAYIWLAIAMLILSVSLSLGMAALLVPLGLSWLYFAMFSIASLSVLFILSIFETKSELFDCKDNELLLSMPISPRDIVGARIAMVLIVNYLVEAVLIVPALIFYAIFSLDMIGVIGGALVALFLPLLATALASIVGYAVAQISRRFRKSTLITVLASLLFVALYFWFITNLAPNIEALTYWLESADPEALVKDMPLLYYLGNASLLSPLPLISVIAISLVVSGLIYFLIVRGYVKIITDIKTAKSAVYKEKKLAKANVVLSLVKKEFKHFLGSAGYMLNAGLGLVFEVVLSVLLLVKSAELRNVGVQIFGDNDFIAVALIGAMIMISSMTMLTASALSVEGDRLWIVKSLPIDSRKLLLSKTLPQIILTTVANLFSSIMIIIASGASANLWAFIIIVPIVANISFAFLGLNINILFPKFNYENEIQAAKQSLSVFITMMTQMIIGILSITLSLVFSFVFNPLVSALLLMAIFVFFSVLFGLLLFGPSARKYESIEV